MTSNHFTKCLNSFFWYALYLLPIIVYIGVSIKSGAFVELNGQFWYSIGLSCLDANNIFYNALYDLVGPAGVFPLFNSSDFILYYVSYCASIFIVHFLIDVILWLVRWAHDMMNRGGKDLWK